MSSHQNQDLPKLIRNPFLAFLLIFSLFLSHCSTVSGRRDEPKAKTFSFPGSYEELWEAAVGTFEVEFIPIEEADKTQGVIRSAEFPIQKNEYRKWAQDARQARSGFGTARLHLSRLDSDSSKLEIAAHFQDARRSVVRRKGKHRHSTGEFENSLAARIHTHFIAKRYPSLFQLVIGCDFRWSDSKNHYEVIGVAKNSLGEEQGFRNGDLVTQTDGREVTLSNFFGLLVETKQNQARSFTLDRDGKQVTISADLFYLDANLPWFGMRSERDQVSGRFKIVSVASNSPASEAGLEVDDYLLAEEGVPLENWKQFYQAATNAKAGIARTFLVERAGAKLTIQVMPKAMETQSPPVGASSP